MFLNDNSRIMEQILRPKCLLLSVVSTSLSFIFKETVKNSASCRRGMKSAKGLYLARTTPFSPQSVVKLPIVVTMTERS